MAKRVVGMPSDFSLNVKKPVELGDYLDETVSAPAAKKPTKNVKPAVPPLEKEAEKEEPKEVKKTEDESAKKKPELSLSKTKTRKPPKRKQINMTPETLDSFMELVTHVREYSQQTDAAASEVMDAIISAHYEARAYLNLSSVPARGRWGTPTARAFRDALSRAFSEALIEHSEQRVKKAVGE